MSVRECKLYNTHTGKNIGMRTQKLHRFALDIHDYYFFNENIKLKTGISVRGIKTWYTNNGANLSFNNNKCLCRVCRRNLFAVNNYIK